MEGTIRSFKCRLGCTDYTNVHTEPGLFFTKNVKLHFPFEAHVYKSTCRATAITIVLDSMSASVSASPLVKVKAG